LAPSISIKRRLEKDLPWTKERRSLKKTNEQRTRVCVHFYGKTKKKKKKKKKKIKESLLLTFRFNTNSPSCPSSPEKKRDYGAETGRGRSR